MRIDLHVHTTASDGTFTPSEAVALAREKGLDAIAITDHDTMEGWLALPEACRSFALPGIKDCFVLPTGEGLSICSVIVFQEPQEGHFPCHLGLSAPHSVQK